MKFAVMKFPQDKNPLFIESNMCLNARNIFFAPIALQLKTSQFCGSCHRNAMRCGFLGQSTRVQRSHYYCLSNFRFFHSTTKQSYVFQVQSNLALRNCLIRDKLVVRNHFLWPNVSLLHKDKEHLALRNNFRVTEKFLITKFDVLSS